jgi:lysophospholipase L1-like esterase
MRMKSLIIMALSTAAATTARGETNTSPSDAMTTTTMYTAQEQVLLDIDRAVYFGPEWNKRVETFHQDNLKREPGGIVMVGDSITDWFPLDKHFPGVNVANRGIAGDTIVGVLKREDESFYELKPSKVFLLIGVNNIASDIDRPLEAYELEYRLIFKRLKERLPKAKIHIQSVMPVAGGLVTLYPTINPTIDAVNGLLKKLAAEYGFEYLDLKPVMADYAADGLHPIEAGYAAWTAFLMPYFEK